MRALILIAALAACAQNPDGSTSIGRPGSPAWHASTSQENKLAYYQGQCSGYGYSANTAQMAQCMQIEAMQSRSHASAQVQNMQNANASMNCTTLGNSTTCRRNPF